MHENTGDKYSTPQVTRPLKRGKKVAILGAGNMGSALASVMGRNGERIALWDHFDEVVEEINRSRTNSRYLPGVTLSGRVTASGDATECVEGAEVVVIAVPSPFVGTVVSGVTDAIRRDAVVLNVVKGLDQKNERPIFTEIAELLPGRSQCLLAGPAIANEFARQELTVVNLAADESEARERVASLLENSRFHTTTTDDMMGAALGGILKNIYALLFGYLETAFPSGRNFEAALLSRAATEMGDIGEAFGARRATLYGLAGLGDLAATALSSHSHNRKCGRLLGQGKPVQAIRQEMGVLPESIRAAAAVLRWIRSGRPEAPLAAVAGGLAAGERFDMTDVLRSFAKARCEALHGR